MGINHKSSSFSSVLSVVEVGEVRDKSNPSQMCRLCKCMRRAWDIVVKKISSFFFIEKILQLCYIYFQH